MLKVATPGKRVRIRAAYGGGAIFNIVGLIDVHVGRISRANNVEGGNSREARSETCPRAAEVPSFALFDASVFSVRGASRANNAKGGSSRETPADTSRVRWRCLKSFRFEF